MLPFLLQYAVRPFFVIYAEEMDKSQTQQALIIPHKRLVNEMRAHGLMHMDKSEAEELMKALHEAKVEKKEKAWTEMTMTPEAWRVQLGKRVRTMAQHVRAAEKKGPAKWLELLTEVKTEQVPDAAATAGTEVRQDVDAEDSAEDDAEDVESEEADADDDDDGGDKGKDGSVVEAAAPEVKVRLWADLSRWPFHGWCTQHRRAWRSTAKKPKVKDNFENVYAPKGPPTAPIVAIFLDGTHMEIKERTIEEHTKPADKLKVSTRASKTKTKESSNDSLEQFPLRGWGKAAHCVQERQRLDSHLGERQETSLHGKD